MVADGDRVSWSVGGYPHQRRMSADSLIRWPTAGGYPHGTRG
jgi:hypothetical protein